MTAAEKPAFDFGSLTVEETALPQRDSGRQRKVQNNPFVTHVQTSWDKQTGMSVTVPKSQAKDAEYLIRQAAKDVGLGVRIVRANSDGSKMSPEAFEKAGNTKQIRLMFQAQEKRKYSPRKSKAEDTVETAVENAAG